MKRISSQLFSIALACACANAQENVSIKRNADTDTIPVMAKGYIPNKTIGINDVESGINTDDMYSSTTNSSETTFGMYDTLQQEHADSLHLPTLNQYGQMPISMYPLDWFGLYNWELHEGLNMNIGASVFASFGKHAKGGAGFAQSISAMYAVPLTNKLSLAIGGYYNNVYWSRDAYQDAGFNAVLGYKFDERWEGYVFVQKSLMNKRIPMPLYDMGNMGDRIGAAVKYNINPSMSIQVSVSAGKVNQPSFSDVDYSIPR
ncbi:MAG: hypothetical protein Q4D41_03680 [Prevotellaceae bacterium]|nr:hypothetical protein [Prevotellaceae bacterium]